MGGPSNLSLSSHRQDDEKYNAKKRQLRQYLPKLAHHLDLLRSRGSQWQQCGTFTVLNKLYQHLTEPGTRVPYHVLLSGEDLLRREVLQIHEASDEAVECLWRSLHFRENVRQKLKDSLKAVNHSIDPENVESQVFLKSRSKDEYLELSARVIIHFKHLKHELFIKQTKEELGNDESSPTTYKSGKKRTSCSTVAPSKKFKCNSL